MTPSEMVIWAAILLLVIFGLKSIQIVPQSEAYIVEQFGKYVKTLNAGLNFILPIIISIWVALGLLCLVVIHAMVVIGGEVRARRNLLVG